MAKKKKKVKHSNLKPLRAELSSLASQANKRASQLSFDNIAIKEARRTLPKSRKKEDVLFKGDIRNLKDIRKEYARIMTFMSDWRSTEEGQEYYERESKYVGAFGGQWLSKYGETYDKSRINEDLATQAFDLYHRLIDEFGEDQAKILWNKDSSKISYGSENMIIAIYVMVEKGFDPEEILKTARNKMILNQLEINQFATKEKYSDDYGSLDDDYISSMKSVKELLNEYANR